MRGAPTPCAAPIQFDVTFAEMGGEGATPYEVLLHAAMIGMDARFTRQDGIEECWRIMQPLLDAPPPVHLYRAARGTGRGERRGRGRRRLVRSVDRRLARPASTANKPASQRTGSESVKVIIVGGVAGGASCAARLRRLDENAEIVMVERGPYVSYANCGLPYHVGGVIEHESDLLVANERAVPQPVRRRLPHRLRGDRRVGARQDRAAARRRDRRGHDRVLRHARAVAGRGVDPPAMPGIDLPGIFQVRTVPDAREIREWIERGTSFLAGMEKYSGFQTVRPQRHAVVVGGGFIGLEMAENLTQRGFEVTVIEMADQVLTPLDPEYGSLVEDFLEMHGVHVVLGDGVAEFEQAGTTSLTVSTQSGAGVPGGPRRSSPSACDPTRPSRRMAGIEIGELGGIRVDEHMRTSDPDIFAVGDAVEVRDFVTGEWSLIALAGPANRQARIAADVIAGRDSRFRGTQGTSVVELFGSAVAWTGANEKTLASARRHRLREGLPLPELPRRLLPGRQADRDEGPLPHKSDGRVLGAQAVGEDGVDKRISVIALAIQMGATVYDLEEAELCYAPPFGSAKDPVNFAGMVAAGVLRGDMPLTPLGDTGDGFILDVRETSSSRWSRRRRLVNIPIGELRSRLDELPRDREIHVVCRSGPACLHRDAMPACRTGSTPGSSPAGCSPRDPRLTGPASSPARPSRPCSARGRAGMSGEELLRVDILAGRVFRDRAGTGALEPVRTYGCPERSARSRRSRATRAGSSPPGGASSTCTRTGPCAATGRGADRHADERRCVRSAAGSGRARWPTITGTGEGRSTGSIATGEPSGSSTG